MLGVPSTHATCVTSVLGEQKLYIDHLTRPFRVENSGRLIERKKPPMTTVCQPRSFNRSYGQMMLCPEGRRHWSRSGYFHQLAPGGESSHPAESAALQKWRAPNWESRRATIYIYTVYTIYTYIILYEKMRKVYVYTGIYTIFIICPSFFLKYLISTMWQNYYII